MMGLRLAEGVSAARCQALFGRPLTAIVPPGRLAPLVEAGFLVADAAGLRATAAGQQRLDAVLRALLA